MTFRNPGASTIMSHSLRMLNANFSHVTGTYVHSLVLTAASEVVTPRIVLMRIPRHMQPWCLVLGPGARFVVSGVPAVNILTHLQKAHTRPLCTYHTRTRTHSHKHILLSQITDTAHSPHSPRPSDPLYLSPSGALVSICRNPPFTHLIIFNMFAPTSMPSTVSSPLRG